MITNVIHASTRIACRLAKPGARAAAGFSVAVALLASPGEVSAKEIATDLVTVETEAIATGLSHPWGLDFLPDGSALVTERRGRLFLFTPGVSIVGVAGLPDVAARGQGGLLDVAVSPDFETSSLIYFSYSEPGRGGAGTAVARGQAPAQR